MDFFWISYGDSKDANPAVGYSAEKRLMGESRKEHADGWVVFEAASTASETGGAKLRR
jgi:hypothetical protein